MPFVGLLFLLVLAFAGGVVLNVMPCVLPVLTLKAFHVVENAHEGRARQRTQGYGYLTGTASAFAVFGAVVVALRAAGHQMGWGLQFQHAPFVAALTAIVFAFALNALGVFELTVSSQHGGGGDGFLSSVGNGWFAALMATPCSAPFLGTAAAFALSSQAAWWETEIIFITVGLGLGAPFALLTFVPSLSRVLPKPGRWMESFKTLMGFTLLATTVWLFDILKRLISPEGSSWFLGFLVLLATGFWGVQRFGGLEVSTARRRFVRVAALGIVTLGAFRMVHLERGPLPTKEARLEPNDDSGASVVDGHIRWTSFDNARLRRELDRGRPVFVDFTADWCASCKTNEAVFLESDPVRRALERTQILPMKADLTEENDELWSRVTKLGRNGLPVYVVYYPDGSHDLLPVAITSDTVVRSLEGAGQKFPPARYGALTKGASGGLKVRVPETLVKPGVLAQALKPRPRGRATLNGASIAFAPGGVTQDVVRLVEHVANQRELVGQIDGRGRQEARGLERAPQLEVGAA
jgi:thiol:disulfide interchange protein